MAEWLKAHAWKACKRATVSRVRIPLSPPFFNNLAKSPHPNAQFGQGEVICACLNVARGTIEAAIAAGPSVSVIGLGAATGAGTNCSSCQPELAQLISAHGAQAETA